MKAQFMLTAVFVAVLAIGSTGCPDPAAYDATPEEEPGSEPMHVEPGSEHHMEPGSEPGSEHHMEPGSEPGSEHHEEPGSEPGSEHHMEPGFEPGSEHHMEPGSEPGS